MRRWVRAIVRRLNGFAVTRHCGVVWGLSFNLQR